MSIPEYSRYKNSNEVWLGDIPHDWDCEPMKYVVNQKTDKVSPAGDIPYVGLENIESNNGLYISTTEQIPEGLSLKFQKEDILFGKLRPYLAKSWLADIDGICSSEFLVLSARKVSPKFLNYLTLSREFIRAIDSSTYGAKMPRASWGFIGQLKVPLPGMDLSHMIAAFLDYETAKIDALIKKQQRLIELLREKRQAVISHAVTKGLNPDAPMRDSGVEWLGEVPEGWEVGQLRHWISNMEQGKSPECENRTAGDREWAVLKSGCVNGGEYDPDENKALPETLSPNANYEVQVGDVLMSRASGSAKLIGSVAYVESTRPRNLLSDKIFRLRLSNKVNNRFFTYFMASSYMREKIIRSISGAEGMANNITKTAILSFQGAIPSLDEQVKIVEHCNMASRQMDALIEKTHSALSILSERRSALISAAVTGKIDVRDWRPPVPEVEVESEAEEVLP